MVIETRLMRNRFSWIFRFAVESESLGSVECGCEANFAALF